MVDFYVYLCDKCLDDVPEDHPRWSDPDNDYHLCWDCAYLKRKITEDEWLKFCGVYSKESYIAVSPQQTVHGCLGIPPEIHPSYDARQHFQTLSNDDHFRAKVYNKNNGKCVGCGSTENLEIDHIKPIARGGNNDMDNLQPLCKSCNAQKSTKTQAEWEEEN